MPTDWPCSCMKGETSALLRCSGIRCPQKSGRRDSKVMTQLTINVVASEGGSTAYLSGSIDIDSSPAVRRRLLALLQESPSHALNVDLSAVTHLDSSGVATLIEALKLAKANRSELRLQGLQGRLLHLFEVTGILSFFNGERSTTSSSG